ncbi:hypothetical protein N9N03_02300 [Chlamydiia bacterium]|nr:hypothetical protein [Chlamydiia bacterium]
MDIIKTEYFDFKRIGNNTYETYFSKRFLDNSDIVYIELPQKGPISQDEVLVVFEDTKAASDVLAPVSMHVDSVNADISSSPDNLSADDILMRVTFTSEALNELISQQKMFT